MQFTTLASDYDGTLATNGELHTATIRALERLSASGRVVILVTGRTLEEMRIADVDRGLFDIVVAENGAVLWCREDASERLLAAPIGDDVAAALNARGVSPLHVGRVIASTTIEHAATLQRAVDELHLPLVLVPNKRSLMLIPPEIDKATGLAAALRLLGRSMSEVVACGDAENDIPMLTAAGCGVAVDNAIPAVKRIADLVTHGSHGEGVTEVIDALIADDLQSLVEEDQEGDTGPSRAAVS